MPLLLIYRPILDMISQSGVILNIGEEFLSKCDLVGRKIRKSTPAVGLAKTAKVASQLMSGRKWASLMGIHKSTLVR